MKKVLFVTYYWPPAGGPGVQRVLKFAKYLPEFGWEPVILTADNPDAPLYDDSLLKDVSPDIKVIKVNGFQPFDLYKKFTGKEGKTIPNDVLIKNEPSFKERFAKWVRANVFIPDAKIGWLPAAVKKGMEVIREENIRLIFSSAPPPTMALVGKKLAEKSGLKWVSDFRDPWLEIVYYQSLKRSKVTVAIDRKLERKALQKADVVTVISKGMAELFRKKVDKDKYIVIPNGYDESDFAEKKFERNEKFTIAYTGSISRDRVPYPLLDALVRAMQEGLKIKLKFVGRFAPEFLEAINSRNIMQLFELSDFVPHSESTKVLQAADVLLLVVDNVPDNKGFLTGKMFEYLGCRKPIFAIGPLNGDANEIIKKADAGEMVDYNDAEGAYRLLKEMYEMWSAGEVKYKFNVEQYSRKNLTKRLSDIFEENIK